MIRKIHLITLALVAAAIAAPIAQATSNGTLISQASRKAASATPNPCRNASALCIYGVPGPSESLAPAATSVASATPDLCRDASALCIYGVPRPSESLAPALTSVASATPDPCRNASALCIYGVPRPSESLASAPTAVASATPAIEVSRPSGFNWGDALGVTVTAGIFLLGAAGALLRHRRRELAHP
jgi:hypothetical protein